MFTQMGVGLSNTVYNMKHLGSGKTRATAMRDEAV
jgi:hypothetical protein